ncbi:MAG: C13 family peptidase, partial [Pseudomonadota bacterium]
NTKLKQSQYPLATQYSVDYVVGNISKKMNLEEDILLMYITSHGSKQATVTFDHNAIKMNDLSAKYLADILEKNSVKRKILMISACYSGSFIEPLKSDNTLIITSASDKDTSFGCADDSEMTWFAKAFFEEGDGNVLDFVNRFHIATKKVTQWEKQKDYEASNPQIYCSADIVDYLNVKILNRSQVFDEKLCNNKPWWQFW